MRFLPDRPPLRSQGEEQDERRQDQRLSEHDEIQQVADLPFGEHLQPGQEGTDPCQARDGKEIGPIHRRRAEVEETTCRRRRRILSEDPNEIDHEGVLGRVRYLYLALFEGYGRQVVPDAHGSRIDAGVPRRVERPVRAP